MNSPEITHEWLIDQGACYYNPDGTPACELGTWLLPKLPMSISTLKRSRKIPVADKLWALYRLMSPGQVKLAARNSALRVLDNWTQEVPTIVMRWLKEGHPEDRKAADYAARSACYAARSAAASAARSAAYSAADCADCADCADYAAYSAAYSAARSAADCADCADSAAYSAARSAAYSAALKDAIAILTGPNK